MSEQNWTASHFGSGGGGEVHSVKLYHSTCSYLRKEINWQPMQEECNYFPVLIDRLFITLLR